MNKQYKYSLAKKGKWICPECGQRTFVCYVDENGNVLDESVGKCDRADKCAHHYPPREYFQDNNLPMPRMTATVQSSLPAYVPPSYMDPDLFKRSVLGTETHTNHLLGSESEIRGTLRFLPQLEMRPSSNAPNPVESREAPPTSSFPDFSEPP